MTRRSFVATLVLGLALVASPALADGLAITGSGIRTKAVGPFSVNVYEIHHFIKDKPAKSKQAVIEADTDKQFALYFKRDVEAKKIKDAFREAFQKNHYADGGKIEQFVNAAGPDKDDIKEWEKGKPPSITIKYNAGAKATTITTAKGSATIQGADFMKGVWSIWFGVIDQPSLGDLLISKL